MDLDSVVRALGFGVVAAAVLALGAVGFTLQFGATNLLNLAYGEVMISSAFVAYVVDHAGLDLWIAFAAATVFGALLSLTLNAFLFTPFIKRGTDLFGMVVVTIALSLILQNALHAIFGPTFFSLDVESKATYRVGSMVFTPAGLGIVIAATAAMLLVHVLLKYTRLGKAMRATSTDAHLARACGIRTSRIINLAWILSGALCGAAGVALVLSVPTFTSTTGTEFLIPIVAAAVLGGVGQPYGAMVGAVVIGISGEIAALVQPPFRETFPFVVLALVLLVRPQGILSEIATKKEVVA